MAFNAWHYGLTLVCAGILGVVVASAPADERLVGKVVITIRDEVIVRRDKRTELACDVGERFTVVKDEGERLDIGPGWVSRRDVLPVDEAIRQFSEAIESAPTADNYYRRASGCFAKGDLTQALLDANECLERDRKHHRAMALRAECWKAKGRFDLAEMNVTDAINIKPI